nr:protein disulfide-isomerase-like protein of the testis [Equus asinus]
MVAIEGNEGDRAGSGEASISEKSLFLSIDQGFNENDPSLSDSVTGADIPSSKQSRNMAEELGKAAEIMGKGKNGVGFGKVDITIEKELQKEFDIKTTPDLKLFFEGNRSEPISCKGNGTWASVKDLEEEVAELFYDVIKDFPELTFGVTSISNAIGRFHITLDSVLVFKKILFILVDADEPTNRHVFKHFRITEVSIPSVQILNLSSEVRYKMPSKEINYKNFKKFSCSFLNKSAKNHQSSEEIPKYWDQGTVKQLVGKNFNVITKERDLFVMFYAPWSEKCRALFPVLEELGRKYQNHPTVTIAKIAITANDIQLMNLDWYPFFRLFPTDSQQAVPYKGEHTMKGFSDFLESQRKTRIEDEDEVRQTAAPWVILSHTESSRPQWTRKERAKNSIILVHSGDT